MAKAQAFVPFLIVTFFIISSVYSDGEPNKVGLLGGVDVPQDVCYATCSASYGTYECNVDCVMKRYSSGACLTVRPGRVDCCCK